jgi:hypothetical protein
MALLVSLIFVKSVKYNSHICKCKLHYIKRVWIYINEDIGNPWQSTHLGNEGFIYTGSVHAYKKLCFFFNFMWTNLLLFPNSTYLLGDKEINKTYVHCKLTHTHTHTFTNVLNGNKWRVYETQLHSAPHNYTVPHTTTQCPTQTLHTPHKHLHSQQNTHAITQLYHSLRINNTSIW